MPTPQQEHQFFDTLAFNSPILEEVEIESVNSSVRGYWIKPHKHISDRVMLYLHGGGFAKYANPTKICAKPLLDGYSP